MESSYSERYKIIQIYKESEFQKIFVGTDTQTDQAVVINNIYIKENGFIEELSNQGYKDIFDSVVHLEKTDDGITIITKAKTGLSLSEYLTELNPILTERVNLIYQYLNGIKKYEPLPDNIKSILVDESQIIIADGKISFSDLIIFNGNTFAPEDFKEVKNNIISILQRLTSLPHIDYGELPLYIKIVEFIDKVRKNDEIYGNIEGIFDGFKELGLLEIKQKEGPVSSGDSSPIKGTPNSLNRDLLIRDIPIKIERSGKPPIAAAAGIFGTVAIVLAVVFALKYMLPLGKNLDADTDLPSKKIIRSADDPTGDRYAEEGPASADDDKIIEPNDNIDYLSECIEKDFTTSKYSDYSFKISDSEDKIHKITVKQAPIEAHSQLLMWVKSDMPDGFNITVEGYSDESPVFRQSVLHKPLNINSWELVRFALDRDIGDYVDIIFDDVAGNVWIDKISIDMFK